MSFLQRLKRGEGPFWGRAKWAARQVLAFHLPVNRATRPAWRALYALHVGLREGWIWARRFFWDEPLLRSQCAAVGAGLWMEQLPYIQGQGRIVLGQGVRLSGRPHFTFNNQHPTAPELIIGDFTYLGHLTDLRIARSVHIGTHCLIAGGVTIADYDGHPLDAAQRRAGATSALKDVHPIEIGNDVWIGQGAVILKGVHIGDRAIVGAHAVVTRDVPADSIVAGNPAQLVRRLQTASEPRGGTTIAEAGGGHERAQAGAASASNPQPVLAR